MTVFAFDTSALLRDHTIIDMIDLTEDRIMFPRTVLDELDSGKSIPGDAGWNARQAIKAVLGLFRNSPESVSFVDCHSNASDADLRIIDACRASAAEGNDVVLVIEDIGMVVRGLQHQSLFKVKTIVEAFPTKARTNTILTMAVSGDLVDSLHDSAYLSVDQVDPEIAHVLADSPIWQSLVLKGHHGKSALAAWDGTGLVRVLKEESGDVKPIGAEQTFARWAIRNPAIPLVCVTGPAGTGKSFLTYAEALEVATHAKDKKVVFVKNFQEVGKGLGFLPGELKDKLAPWMDSVRDTINAIYGSKSKAMFEALIAKEALEIVPMSYIRGRTFNKCFLVFDEAQNTTPHEIKTVITRAGKDTKVVVLGDTHQIDLPKHGTNSCGLGHVTRRMARSKHMMHCHLSETHRSDLAKDAADLL